MIHQTGLYYSKVSLKAFSNLVIPFLLFYALDYLHRLMIYFLLSVVLVSIFARICISIKCLLIFKRSYFILDM